MFASSVKLFGEEIKVCARIATMDGVSGHADKHMLLDWLGHLLYGMNRQESIFPNVGADAAAHALSSLSSMSLAPEPTTMQQAWDIGSELVKQNKASRDTTFKDTQTATPQEAFVLAAAQMTKIYPDATDVACSGNCNPIPGTDDIVNCTDAQGRRIEFVFDDICD